MNIWSLNGRTIIGSSIGLKDTTSTMLSSSIDIWIDQNHSIYVIDSDINYRVQIYYSGSLSGITIITSTQGRALNQFSSGKILFNNNH